MLTSVRRTVINYWQPFSLFILAAGPIIFLYIFRLGTLVPGLSSSEVIDPQSVSHITAILNDPFNLIYKIYEYVLLHFNVQSIGILRLFGPVFMCFTALIFYFLLKWRYDPFVAFLGTVVFAISSWVLHITRLASPEVLGFSIIWLLYSARLLRSDQHMILKSFLALTILALLIYVPGMIWFLILASFWQRRHIVERIQSAGWTVTSLAGIWVLILLIPLGWSFIHSIDNIPTFFGFSLNLPSVSQYAINFYHVPEYLFIKGPPTSDRWLGNLPLLDVFSTAMFALGAYCLWLQRRLDFTQTLAGMVLLAWILVAFGGPVTISMLVPIIYIVIASGFALLLKEWVYVFPKNPLARGFGFTLIILSVAIIGFYHFDRYFVAWAHNPTTLTYFKPPS